VILFTRFFNYFAVIPAHAGIQFAPVVQTCSPITQVLRSAKLDTALRRYDEREKSGMTMKDTELIPTY